MAKHCRNRNTRTGKFQARKSANTVRACFPKAGRKAAGARAKHSSGWKLYDIVFVAGGSRRTYQRFAPDATTARRSMKQVIAREWPADHTARIVSVKQAKKGQAAKSPVEFHDPSNSRVSRITPVGAFADNGLFDIAFGRYKYTGPRNTRLKKTFVPVGTVRVKGANPAQIAAVGWVYRNEDPRKAQKGRKASHYSVGKPVIVGSIRGVVELVGPGRIFVRYENGNGYWIKDMSKIKPMGAAEARTFMGRRASKGRKALGVSEEFGFTTFENPKTRRAASVRKNAPGQWMAFFGRMDRQDGFVVSPQKSSRTYKTETGAIRAAQKWARS